MVVDLLRDLQGQTWLDLFVHQSRFEGRAGTVQSRFGHAGGQSC